MRTRTVVLTVAIAAGLVALTASPAAAADPKPCLMARAMIDESRPGDAVTLITSPDANATAICPDDLVAAQAAIATAIHLTDEAAANQRTAEDAGADPDSQAAAWEQALVLAERALALDKSAHTTDGTATAHGIKAAADKQTQAEASFAESAKATWDRFVDAVRPLGDPALAFAVALAILGILGRAFTPATLNWPMLTVVGPGRRHLPGRLLGVAAVAALLGTASLIAMGLPARWSKVDGWDDSPAIWIASMLPAAVALVAFCLVALLRPPSDGSGAGRDYWRKGWTQWVVGTATTVLAVLTLGLVVPAFRGNAAWGLVECVAGAALAILLLATWLGTRLRVSVTVRGTSIEPTDKDPSQGSGHLIAMLSELGAEPPRGLEMARGSDVEALSGQALSGLPENAVLKFLVAVVQGLFGTAPWRVSVEQHDRDKLSVVISRNGRAAGSKVIERKRLLAELPDDIAANLDLYRAAAAEVLITLARHHYLPGLCGATTSTSLALHYFATTDLAEKPEHQRTLLARAVDSDPDNYLAQLALWNARWRDSTDEDELTEYLSRLDAFLDGRRGSAALRMELKGASEADVTSYAARADASAHTAAAARDMACAALDALSASAATAQRDLVALSDELTPGATLEGRLRESLDHQGALKRVLAGNGTSTEVDCPGFSRATAEDTVQKNKADVSDGQASQARAASEAAQTTQSLQGSAEHALASISAAGTAIRALLGDPDVSAPSRMDGFGSLRLRALYTRAAVAINRTYVTTDDKKKAHAELARTGAVRALKTELDAGSRTASESLIAAIRDASEAFPMLWLGEPGTPAAPRTPHGEYNLGCFYASVSASKAKRNNYAAVKHLRRATDVPSLAAWVHDDPQLEALRKTSAFRRGFGDAPIEEFLAMPALKAESPTLRALGVLSEGALRNVQPTQLASVLGIVLPRAVAVRQVASAAWGVPPSRARYDIAQVLVDAGLTGKPVSGFPTDVQKAVRDRVARLKLTRKEYAAVTATLDSWL